MRYALVARTTSYFMPAGYLLRESAAIVMGGLICKQCYQADVSLPCVQACKGRRSNSTEHVNESMCHPPRPVRTEEEARLKEMLLDLQDSF